MSNINEQAITQRVEFAETELKSALELCGDFSDEYKIMSAENMGKIRTALQGISQYATIMSEYLQCHEDLLKLKNSQKHETAL